MRPSNRPHPLLAPPLWLALLALMALAQAAGASVTPASDRPLGRELASLDEEAGAALTWEGALERWRSGQFRREQQTIPTRGLAARPLWLALPVSADERARRHLLVDTAWMDRVDGYLIHQNRLIRQWHTGDTRPNPQRYPLLTGYTQSLDLPAGESLILLRLQTPDPMVAPVYLLDHNQRQAMVLERLFSYGLGYGYLLALILYNALLFAGLKDRRHLLYAVYLSLFTLANFSYTGHGWLWAWPESVEWQRWGQPLLMCLFGWIGLLFSVEFLDTRHRWRRGYRACLLISAITALLLCIAFITASQALALYTAFAFMGVFTSAMLILGIRAVRHGSVSGRYYLIAVICGTIGTLITTLSTWGLVPTSEWAFRAAELGMLLEATLLALALASRIRQTQRRHRQARHDALTDPLTGLANRRAVHERLRHHWVLAERDGRPLSLVLLDLDHFKALNDTYGHDAGDSVLKQVAQRINALSRAGDLAARWGGEEFMLVMPHCDSGGACELAERLRSELAGEPVTHGGQRIPISGSFGVAERQPEDRSEADLVRRADRALYRAKLDGRNRVNDWQADAPTDPRGPAQPA